MNSWKLRVQRLLPLLLVLQIYLLRHYLLPVMYSFQAFENVLILSIVFTHIMNKRNIFLFSLITASLLPFGYIVLVHDSVGDWVTTFASLSGFIGGVLMLWSFLLGVRMF